MARVPFAKSFGGRTYLRRSSPAPHDRSAGYPRVSPGM